MFQWNRSTWIVSIFVNWKSVGAGIPGQTHWWASVGLERGWYHLGPTWVMKFLYIVLKKCCAKFGKDSWIAALLMPVQSLYGVRGQSDYYSTTFSKYITKNHCECHFFAFSGDTIIYRSYSSGSEFCGIDMLGTSSARPRPSTAANPSSVLGLWLKPNFQGC